jgi:dehydrogenases with different specificities (related to short-chain alcohol dehydrogenases)
MSIKKYLKRAFVFLLHGIPERHVIANITKLAPNEMLKGRTALITGATSGIGFEIAKSYLEAGAKVIITGRDKDRIQHACSLLKSIHQNYIVHGIQMNNCDVPIFKEKLEEMLRWKDINQIDILVNNAGVLGGDIRDTTEIEYDNIVNTNLKGVFFLSQMIGHYYKEQHIEGNILNIASSSSLRPAASAYTITKWGIRGLTLGLAKILTPYGIIVNGIAPGPTATRMIFKESNTDIAFKNPIGRCAMPEEIANMAVFLVSNMGRSIVGDIIYMTGGSGLITLDDVNYEF